MSLVIVIMPLCLNRSQENCCSSHLSFAVLHRCLWVDADDIQEAGLELNIGHYCYHNYPNRTPVTRCCGPNAGIGDFVACYMTFEMKFHRALLLLLLACLLGILAAYAVSKEMLDIEHRLNEPEFVQLTTVSLLTLLRTLGLKVCEYDHEMVQPMLPIRNRPNLRIVVCSCQAHVVRGRDFEFLWRMSLPLRL